MARRGSQWQLHTNDARMPKFGEPTPDTASHPVVAVKPAWCDSSLLVPLTMSWKAAGAAASVWYRNGFTNPSAGSPVATQRNTLQRGTPRCNLARPVATNKSKLGTMQAGRAFGEADRVEHRKLRGHHGGRRGGTCMGVGAYISQGARPVHTEYRRVNKKGK